MSFDAEKIRQQFPILSTFNRNRKPLIFTGTMRFEINVEINLFANGFKIYREELMGLKI
jgi:hypothetical protein